MCEKDFDCDLLIVIGTSLSVDGVKKIVKTFCKGPNSEVKRILVNLTKPTKECESYFDYFYEGDCIDFVNDLKKVTAGKQVKKLEVLKVDQSTSNETDESVEIYQSKTV
jgi:NAD-dependent SIR2 family protein deacetylase